MFYPYELLLRHTGVMQHLEEWQPVNFSAWNGKLGPDSNLRAARSSPVFAAPMEVGRSITDWICSLGSGFSCKILFLRGHDHHAYPCASPETVPALSSGDR